MSKSKSDNKVKANYVLLSYYVKYNRLLELNNAIKIDSLNLPYIDIYIDLFDMLDKLYNTNIYADKSLSIVSSIINLVGHIRSYYRNKHGIYSRIFLIYADESYIPNYYPVNMYSAYEMDYVPELSDSEIHIQKSNQIIIDSLIKSQLELVKILVAYIQDVYYIPKHYSFATITYDLILNNNAPMSIVFSNFKYNFIIPAMCDSNNVFLIRPIKYNGEDRSVIINHSRSLTLYYSKYLADASIKVNLKFIDNITYLNPKLISYIWVLAGSRYKKIYSIYSITDTVKFFKNAIKNLKIDNDYISDPKFVYNALKETISESKTDCWRIDSLQLFVSRFCTLDLIFNYRVYKNSPESLDNTWYINLQDPHTVMEINNKHFADNPLNLSNL